MTDATHPGKSPRTTWGPVIYVVVLLSLWCGLLAVVSGRGAVRVEDLPGVLVLAVLALVSAVVRDNGRTGAAHSFTAVISLTCLPLFGPTGAGIIGLAIALLDRTAGVSIVRVFNAVMLGVITLSGGLVYLLVGGVHPVPSGWSAVQLLVRVGLPLLAADLTMCLVNVLVLAGMIAITGSSPRQVLAGTVRELVPLFVAYALIAFLFVLLWGDVYKRQGPHPSDAARTGAGPPLRRPGARGHPGALPRCGRAGLVPRPVGPGRALGRGGGPALGGRAGRAALALSLIHI